MGEGENGTKERSEKRSFLGGIEEEEEEEEKNIFGKEEEKI